MPYVSPEDAQDRLSPEERTRYDSEEAAMLALVTRAPTLRPRMLKLLDTTGDIQRINIGKIVRWWLEPAEGETPAHTAVKFENGDTIAFPDPQGQVDEALCSAFFDVTVHDLA